METILDRIMAAKRDEVALLKQSFPLDKVQAQVAARPAPLDFTGALRGPRPRSAGSSQVNVIAEVKRGSPSKGTFDWHGDAARQGFAYQTGGAKAISVVTDGPFFQGSVEMLQAVKAAVDLPVIQKEFLLEPYQVYYARSLGADACLLIGACLPGDLLGEMIAVAREVGIHTLVEVVDEEELSRAIDGGAEVIGVNNRDLRTFKTDPNHTLTLLPGIGEERVAVTESGIHTREDIERMLAAGVDAFLIGEALMIAEDPAHHLRILRGEVLGQQEAAS